MASVIPTSKEGTQGGVPTYQDHSSITDDNKELNDLMEKADAEGVKGTDQTFPVKLHQLLSGSDDDGFSHIVSWQAHGRSFIVKKHSEFVDKVLPCCFRQSKFASFQRQLNLYGFRRITQGRDKGGYFHELFLRGRALLALKMQRTKVKGTGARKASSPETEPDFYAMPFVNETKKPATPAATTSAPAPANVAMSPLLQPSVKAPPGLATMVSPNQAAPNAHSEDLHSRLGQSSPPSSNRAKPLIDGWASSALYGLNNPGDLSRMASLQLTSGLTNSHQEKLAYLLAAPPLFQPRREPAGLGGNSAVGNSFNPFPGLPSSPWGPLHLNALNMPCNCALPAF